MALQLLIAADVHDALDGRADRRGRRVQEEAHVLLPVRFVARAGGEGDGLCGVVERGRLERRPGAVRGGVWAVGEDGVEPEDEAVEVLGVAGLPAAHGGQVGDGGERLGGGALGDGELEGAGVGRDELLQGDAARVDPAHQLAVGDQELAGHHHALERRLGELGAGHGDHRADVDAFHVV